MEKMIVYITSNVDEQMDVYNSLAENDFSMNTNPKLKSIELEDYKSEKEPKVIGNIFPTFPAMQIEVNPKSRLVGILDEFLDED